MHPSLEQMSWLATAGSGVPAAGIDSSSSTDRCPPSGPLGPIVSEVVSGHRRAAHVARLGLAVDAHAPGEIEEGFCGHPVLCPLK